MALKPLDLTSARCAVHFQPNAAHAVVKVTSHDLLSFNLLGDVPTHWYTPRWHSESSTTLVLLSWQVLEEMFEAGPSPSLWDSNLNTSDSLAEHASHAAKHHGCNDDPHVLGFPRARVDRDCDSEGASTPYRGATTQARWVAMARVAQVLAIRVSSPMAAAADIHAAVVADMDGVADFAAGANLKSCCTTSTGDSNNPTLPHALANVQVSPGPTGTNASVTSSPPLVVPGLEAIRGARMVREAYCYVACNNKYCKAKQRFTIVLFGQLLGSPS